ncbi:MAG: DNA-processing protein DprA, partial [Planctomycetes bacterium]|nr:DNA-processing protein DprA [Planctomycetota bacterium]
GVATFAHIGAMNGGGRTIGVLGCGFDHMYPEQNRDLAIEMSKHGAVITEYPMATRPSRETFPMRNRIIAGMSYGLLVIEAPLRSGSLITARLANEFGRTVFAIPGRVDDIRSEGCNKLIRDGAVIVTSVEDIFRELNPSLPEEMYMKERPARAARAKPKPPANEPPGRRPRLRERAVPETAPPRPSDSLFDRDPADIKETLDWVMDRNFLAEPADTEYGAPPKGRDARREAPRNGAPRNGAPQPVRDAPGHANAPRPSRREPACNLAADAPGPAVDEAETAVLRVLSQDWRPIDDIIAECGLDSGKSTACLAMLRLKRLVEQGPGQAYRLRS